MASPSSPPHSEDAVCCMCGDHGLPRELFRCRSCRVRLQHSYCSNMYPRTATYRRCNWCLIKEPPPIVRGGAGAADRTAHHEAEADGDSKPVAEKKRKAATAAASDEEQRRHEVEGYSWRRPPAALGYPVKKKRNDKQALDERVAPPPPRDAGVMKAGRSCGDAAAARESDRKEVVRAGKAPPAPRVRVKVRRYKLLAEVIIGC